MDSPAGRWRSYFLSECEAALGENQDGRPTTPSVTVDLIELHRADQELAKAVLREPDRLLSAARTVLRDLTDGSGPVLARIENNPHLCDVSELSARQLHELVTVRGVVDAVGPMQASTVRAAFTCPACGDAVQTTPTGVERGAPSRCEGCEWDGPFEFDSERSEFVDTQRLSLTPVPDRRDDAGPTEPIPAYVHGDLVGEVAEDSHVGVTGVLRVRESEDAPLFSPYLDGLNVRDERDVTLPDSLREALDAHWEST